MNAVEEEFSNSRADYDPEVLGQEIDRASKYLPYRPGFDKNSPYLMQMMFSRPLVRDADKYLEK